MIQQSTKSTKKVIHLKRKPKIGEKEGGVDYKDMVITYTWCECGENHHGNQQVGEIASVGNGFTTNDLMAAQNFAETNYGCSTELFNLNNLGLLDEMGVPLVIKNKKEEIVEVKEAHFLLIRDFIPKILEKNNLTMGDLMKEVTGQYWDTKYWDTRRQKVLNKHARKNNCIAEIGQVADYEKGMGTIHSFESMKIMNLLRTEFQKIGSKFEFACGEGNLYEDGGKKKNGIGWHGDSERRRVLSMRLGLNPSMPFYYRWKYRHQEIGKLMRWEINAGDVMVMSEWAVGTEWKSSSKVTLVHSTGAKKYVKPKNNKKE